MTADRKKEIETAVDLAEYVRKESQKSAVSTLLLSKAKEVSDDLNYICGVFAYLETDEERQRMIDYISSSKIENEEQLLLTAMYMAEQNQP